VTLKLPPRQYGQASNIPCPASRIFPER